MGDVLLLRRYDPETRKYTGQKTVRKITYLLDLDHTTGGKGSNAEKMCVLGLEEPSVHTLQAELDRVTAERDAAIADIPHECGTCAHLLTDEECTIGSKQYCFWKWRGASRNR